jgi:hypothetical protein
MAPLVNTALPGEWLELGRDNLLAVASISQLVEPRGEGDSQKGKFAPNMAYKQGAVL